MIAPQKEKMKVKVEKQPKSTLSIEITIPVVKVKQAYSKILKDVATSTTIEGFRKGQAPESVVKEKMDPSKMYGEVINQLLEDYYPQALKENKINPISNPKVEIKEFDLEKDFTFVAEVAVKPEISIKKSYKNDLKKLYETRKKAFDKEKKEAAKDSTKEIPGMDFQLSANEIIAELVKTTKFEVADLLVDEEVNRMFSRVVQQTQAIGMGMEDFLKSQNKTAENLKDEYHKSAVESIKAEFILGHLIAEEGITLEAHEVDEMINALGDEKMKEQMQSPIQQNYIRSILLKNKLLANLVEAAEGKKETKKETK